MKRALIYRGVADSKVTVIRNWARAELRERLPCSEQTGPFTLVYGGNFGRAQQLGNLIQAAAILEADRPGIRIELFGSGVDEAELRREAANLGLRNIRFAGRVAEDEIARQFAAADALLLHLGDDPLFDITIPSKTQDYLASARPIIAAVNGETADLLRESGAAIIVPPGDPEALARAIVNMADTPTLERQRMASAGAEFYRSCLSFSEGIDRTVRLIEGTYEAVAVGRGSR
jgi:glycosyltransferase involved in cell wall biosynthesis